MHVASQSTLMFDTASDEPGSENVCVRNLAPTLLAALDDEPLAVRSVLTVSVVQNHSEDLPNISGRYELLKDGIRFVPHFPFETGVGYQAKFDTRSLGLPEFSELLRLEFALPRKKVGSPAYVTKVFPFNNVLPENLLRFYVCFSNPMQRGLTKRCVTILGPDGQPAPDVLYRAPLELWDKSMRCLTILLDPGRLKRGLGPNRELGPPLKSGVEYTLMVDSKMLDSCGNQLRKGFHKTFLVREPVRQGVSIDDWSVLPPVTGTPKPLTLVFPRPLDWALLFRSITIESTGGEALEGQISVEPGETQWNLTPRHRWAPGSYWVRVAEGLEDVCGNNLLGPFDRPIRSAAILAPKVASQSKLFRLT